jgi:hypothetical protein
MGPRQRKKQTVRDPPLTTWVQPRVWWQPNQVPKNLLPKVVWKLLLVFDHVRKPTTKPKAYCKVREATWNLHNVEREIRI